MRFKITEWTYVEATIAAFVFVSEVRRIAAWALHSDALSVLSVVPIAMLVPIVFFTYKRRSAVLKAPIGTIALVWIAAFAYALVVGIAQKSLLPGLYGIGSFVLPAAIGAWFLSRPESLEVSFSRISRDLLIWGAIAGAYGIFQYVVAPSWDTEWMQKIEAESFGNPVPYGIRVFSVLNGPGVFGNFMATALILNLRAVRVSKPLTIFAMFLMLVGLLLSMVRIAWLAFALGAVITIALSPDRRRVASGLAIISVLLLATGGSFVALTPNDDIRTKLADRFTTLGDVQSDPSLQERRETGGQALRAGVGNPVGFGLGTTGLSGSLNSNTEAVASGIPTGVIDNGFISRFVEMGVLGFAGFGLSLLLAIIATYRAYLHALRRSSSAASIVACMLATQVALLFMCLSGDVYAGIGSVTLFLSLGIALLPAQTTRSEAVSVPKRAARTTRRKSFAI